MSDDSEKLPPELWPRPEPPPNERPPEPKLSFGAQCMCGIFVVLGLVALCWGSRSDQLWVLCTQFVPIAAIIGCFFRPIRGFAVGMLLGIGLAGLALLGICVAGLRGL